MLPFNIYKLARRAGGNLLRTLKLKPALPEAGTVQKHGKLYFHPHSFRWFKEQIKPLMDYQVYPWRSVTVSFTRSSIRAKLGGKLFLDILYRLEERFPRWFGKHGAYPMIVIKKSA